MTLTILAMLGSYREDALMRVLAFLWAFVAAFVVGIVGIIALIWGLIDVVWQLVFNSEGLDETGFAPEFVANTFWWAVDLEVYAFTGRKKFMWLPEMP